jgi:hypothetical protein
MLSNLLIIVGVSVAAAFAGRWLYQKDTEVEDRRRAALKTAEALRGKGLTSVSAFFEDYAVGDYSGMAKKLKDTAITLANSASLQGEFAVVFEKLLAEKLADPAEAAKLADKAVKASEPSGLVEVAKAVAAKVASVVA